MFYKTTILCLLAILCVFVFQLSAQDQKVADSLLKIYEEKKLTDTAELELLRNLSFNELKDLNLSLKYANELILRATQEGNTKYLHVGYYQKGNKKRMLGDLEDALDAYFKCVEVARKSKFIAAEGSDYAAIADVYSVMDNHRDAMMYYHKAIPILRQARDSIALASVILNAGESFRRNKNYDSALVYFKESGIIFEKKDYLPGEAYSIGNIGMVYASLGKDDLATQNINNAISILEKLQDYSPVSDYLISMSDIYSNKGDEQKALNYALQGLTLAQQFRLKEQISAANLKVSQLYEKERKLDQSFEYYKNYIVYRDSLVNLKTIQKMADLRIDYEVSQKQTQVNLLQQQKKNQRLMMLAMYIILGLTFTILFVLYHYYRNISAEKKRSESLLLNILPAETALQLKQKGKIEAVKFDEVTVLFTDFLAFTRTAEKENPEQLVKSIDYYFKAFDEITTRYGLEKIKTIGDSYMCACGLPTPNPAHATQVMKAASDMIAVVEEEFDKTDGLNHFEIRIGVHTGPVVAGIVGIKKWQYDIWGDTVNIASRMEANSKAGRVNLSNTTYLKIKDQFPCEYRGEIQIKNHGPMKMYFLSE